MSQNSEELDGWLAGIRNRGMRSIVHKGRSVGPSTGHVYGPVLEKFIDFGKQDVCQEIIGRKLEQEHLQFLMDHNLFYWKLDRYMLRAEDIPSIKQISADRKRAHEARQSLLDLWKKKDSRVL